MNSQICYKKKPYQVFGDSIFKQTNDKNVQ